MVCRSPRMGRRLRRPRDGKRSRRPARDTLIQPKAREHHLRHLDFQARHPNRSHDKDWPNDGGSNIPSQQLHVLQQNSMALQRNQVRVRRHSPYPHLFPSSKQPVSRVQDFSFWFFCKIFITDVWAMKERNQKEHSPLSDKLRRITLFIEKIRSWICLVMFFAIFPWNYQHCECKITKIKIIFFNFATHLVSSQGKRDAVKVPPRRKGGDGKNI